MCVCVLAGPDPDTAAVSYHQHLGDKWSHRLLAAIFLRSQGIQWVLNNSTIRRLCLSVGISDVLPFGWRNVSSCEDCSFRLLPSPSHFLLSVSAVLSQQLLILEMFIITLVTRMLYRRQYDPLPVEDLDDNENTKMVVIPDSAWGLNALQNRESLWLYFKCLLEFIYMYKAASKVTDWKKTQVNLCPKPKM